jgi:hypothetical protein
MHPPIHKLISRLSHQNLKECWITTQNLHIPSRKNITYPISKMAKTQKPRSFSISHPWATDSLES